jgi:branched-chain amino acid transport system permease protein
MSAIAAEASGETPRPHRLRAFGDAAGIAAVALAGILAALAFPDDLALLTRIVGMAFLVLALDLVTGVCGVATLGHAALYGVAAYGAGYASARLGIRDPLLLVAIGAGLGAFTGLAAGAIILRASGLPQLVLSIATVQLVHEGANKFSGVTGGSDGLSGIEIGPLLGLFAFDLWGRTAYWFSLTLLLVTLLVLRRVVASPFGLLCRGLRQDPVRVRAMGAPAYPALLRMYVVSGLVAGIGGALTAVTAGVVGLDSVSFERSAQALVMLTLGGAGTLYGALAGTAVFAGFEHIVSAANPFHWLATVGALLIAVVLFVPKGLQGLPAWLLGRLRGIGWTRP